MDASVAANLEADAVRLRSELAGARQARPRWSPRSRRSKRPRRPRPAASRTTAPAARMPMATTVPGPRGRRPRSAASSTLAAWRSSPADEEMGRLESHLGALAGRHDGLDQDAQRLQARPGGGRGGGAPAGRTAGGRRGRIRCGHRGAGGRHRRPAGARTPSRPPAARGSMLSLWRWMPLAPGRAPSTSPPWAACSAPCSIWWRSTMAGKRRPRRRWARHCAAVVVADATAARQALAHLAGAGLGGGVVAAPARPRCRRRAAGPAVVRAHVHARDPAVDELARSPSRRRRRRGWQLGRRPRRCDAPSGRRGGHP